MLPIFQYYILCRSRGRYRFPQFTILEWNHSFVRGKRLVFDITKPSTLKTMLYHFSEFLNWKLVWCQCWKQLKLKATYAQSNLFLVFNVIKNNGNAFYNSRICTAKSSHRHIHSTCYDHVIQIHQLDLQRVRASLNRIKVKVKWKILCLKFCKLYHWFLHPLKNCSNSKAAVQSFPKVTVRAILLLIKGN